MNSAEDFISPIAQRWGSTGEAGEGARGFSRAEQAQTNTVDNFET
jgi:hypothetical protein